MLAMLRTRIATADHYARLFISLLPARILTTHARHVVLTFFDSISLK